MTALLVASAGMALAGPVGALAALSLSVARTLSRSRPAQPGIRPVLMMMLVELRSGQSVMSAMQMASRRFPDHHDLATTSRLALVSGLEAAVDSASADMRPLLVQLLRAQQSGGSAADAIRRALESDLTREKTVRLSRARTLPVRLMIPLTLLVLPGVILLAYGPSLISMLQSLVNPFG